MNHQLFSAVWSGLAKGFETQFLPVVGYFVLYVLLVMVGVEVQRRRRNSKMPFRNDDRLLRGPGEGVRKRWEDMTDKLVLQFLYGAILPPGVGLLAGLAALVMVASGLLSPRVIPYVWRINLGGTLIVAYFSTRILSLAVLAVGDCYLGYLGERYVADRLAPLALSGWRIIHDLPCPMGNIDHVLVGRGGVFAVETKAKRKRGTRSGNQHVVTFDGQSLGWPWGTDTEDLEQVEKNALWLRDEIKRTLQRKAFVTPVLTIPGWWVEPKDGAAEPRYAQAWNPKWFEKRIGDSPRVLAPDDVDAIAAELESRCRDVEF